MYNKEKTFLLGISLLLLSQLAQASGFRIPEVSATGTASSNALVANTEELGAVPYNPAANAFHEGTQLQLGVNGVRYETTVTPNGGTTTTGVGEDFFAIPNLIFSVNDDSKVGFVMLINAPFGLETLWPDETFPGFVNVVISAGPPSVTLDNIEPEFSRIKMLNYNPNISYKFDSSTSASFGLDLYDVIDLTFNSQAIKINGRGEGVGYNFGVLHKAGALTMGLSYRSSVRTNIDGYFDTTQIGGSVIAASAQLKFPSLLQLGVNYQFNKNLGLEFDIDRTGWKSFDKIEVKESGGNTLTSSTNNWKDSTAYRLGLHYVFSPTFKLMAGYSYDDSPQPDAYFSARVPDADRQLFSLGAKHTLGNVSVEYAYMHVEVDDRTVNSSTSFAGEPNGSSLYNGTYESKVDIFGLSLSMKF